MVFSAFNSVVNAVVTFTSIVTPRMSATACSNAPNTVGQFDTGIEIRSRIEHILILDHDLLQLRAYLVNRQ